MTGFLILVVLALLALWVYVELARFPGQKARDRRHPQADAINVLSWVGLLFGGLPWLVALVWAYTNPHPTVAAAVVPGPGGVADSGSAESGAGSEALGDT